MQCERHERFNYRDLREREDAAHKTGSRRADLHSINSLNVSYVMLDAQPRGALQLYGVACSYKHLAQVLSTLRASNFTDPLPKGLSILAVSLARPG
jgi:hypothetical protein